MPAQPPQVLLRDLAIIESGRWHDGRMWFAHWGAGEIISVDPDGKAEVAAEGHPSLGWSIDWLPDGRLLRTGPLLERREPDGTWVQHADTSAVAEHGWNEIVIDPRGNIFLNGFGFDFLGGGRPEPGIIAVVQPDGSARKVAADIIFPNGMVITPDGGTLIVAESMASRLTAFDIADDGGLSNRRVWAGGVGPDGICMDAEGAIWCGAAGTSLNTGNADDPPGALVRVREGGEILDRVELDQPVYACTLGGADGRTLYLLASDWDGPMGIDAVIERRPGRLLSVEVDVPAAGS